MSGLKILYVASEMAPFLDTSSTAALVQHLSKVMRSKDAEVRVIVPRFCVINERRNRLHEVLRLTGINIPIATENRSLVMKVSSIREARLQVYFTDNDFFFHNRKGLLDEKGSLYKNSSEWIVFFCKSVLATIKQLGWAPDIIQCHDWLTALIPMYMRTTYKREPTLCNAKSVFVLHENTFPGTMDANLVTYAKMQDVSKAALAPLEKGSFPNLVNLAMKYAHKVVKGTTEFSGEHQAFLKGIDAPTLAMGEDVIAQYEALYEKTVKKKKKK